VRGLPASCAPHPRLVRPGRRHEVHFPATIDPRIYHVKLIRRHLGELTGRRVLDVGCGKAASARVLHDQEPAAEICGFGPVARDAAFRARGRECVRAVR